MRGIRYKSMRIVDYDICEECFEANHKHLTMADAFVAFKKNTVVNEDFYFEDSDSLRIDARNWKDLQRFLDKPKVQNVDLMLTARGYVNYAEVPLEEAVGCISNSASLKSIYINFFSTGPPQADALNVARAIMHAISVNSSIVTLSIRIDFSVPLMEVIYNIIRNSKSIRYVFVHQIYEREFNADEQVEEQQHRDRESEAALGLFQALADTSSIHSFVCDGDEQDRGEACRLAAVHALRTRPSLKRIKADFRDNDELKRLMSEKKQTWIKDWNDLKATTESRVMILEEVLSCKQVDEEDQVAALYHFFRGNPGALPELRDSTAGSAKRIRRR